LRPNGTLCYPAGVSYFLQIFLLNLLILALIAATLYFEWPPIFLLMFALYAFAPLVALVAEIGDWLESKIG
jgi:hypothetical protein